MEKENKTKDLEESEEVCCANKNFCDILCALKHGSKSGCSCRGNYE